MRILLLSKADLFGSVILNRLVPVLRRDNEIAVCLSDRIFPNERGFPATDRFMHYTRDVVVERFFPALDGRVPGSHGEMLTFHGLGTRYDVPMTNLGGEVMAARAVTESIAEGFQPDVILCCRHDFIVMRSVFAKARLGAYNLHSGAVPYYRGPFCSFWAMLNRETRIGCSLHSLAEKVDTGDIVGTAWLPLDSEATLTRTLVDTYAAGVDLFLSFVPCLFQSPLPGLPQPENMGWYYPQPDAGDYELLRLQGGRVVDAEECRRFYERYLPAGTALDEVMNDWKWAEE